MSRPIVFLFALVLTLTALAACGGASGAPLPPMALTVVVGDDKFEPNLLTGKVNQPIALTVENRGAKPHSFVIDELQVKIPEIAPGQSGAATFTSRQIRTYTNGGAYLFYSDVAGDKAAGLTGNLSINP